MSIYDLEDYPHIYIEKGGYKIVYMDVLEPSRADRFNQILSQIKLHKKVISKK